jgi:hypothetical protein
MLRSVLRSACRISDQRRRADRAKSRKFVRCGSIENLCPSHRKFRSAAPHENYKIGRDDCRRLVMTKGYIAADVAIKTAYFSFVVAAFIFVSMLLLAGVHP